MSKGKVLAAAAAVIALAMAFLVVITSGIAMACGGVRNTTASTTVQTAVFPPTNAKLPTGNVSGLVTSYGKPVDLSVYTFVKQLTVEERQSPRLMAGMVYATGVETNFGTDPNIARGPAFGYWMIEQPGVVNTSVTVAQAMDPQFAAKYMLPLFEKAMNKVDPSLWQNPATHLKAVNLLAYNAEKPRYDYMQTRTAADIQYVWDMTLKIMQALQVSTDFTTENAVLTGDQSSANVIPAGYNCNGYSNLNFVQSGAAQTVIKEAQKWLCPPEGLQCTPYVFGGGNINGPTSSGLAHGNYGEVGFDCSSFTQYLYHKVGIELPRTSQAQYEQFKANVVPLDQAKPGDLLFSQFGVNGPGPDHVSIVFDPSTRKTIEAPRTGKDIGYSTYMSDAVAVHILPDTPVAAEGTVLASGWQWPLHGQLSISSPWGMRTHPVTKVYKLHDGTDFVAPMGTPVYAVNDGTISVETNNAVGLVSVVDHGGGIVSKSEHLSKFVVTSGPVKAGQLIAYSGNSGQYTTGPHLHFTMEENGKSIDPVAFMEAHGLKLSSNYGLAA